MERIERIESWKEIKKELEKNPEELAMLIKVLGYHVEGEEYPDEEINSSVNIMFDIALANEKVDSIEIIEIKKMFLDMLQVLKNNAKKG